MQNLRKLNYWEEGSIFKNIVKILYHEGNIDIVSYRENFKGANLLTNVVISILNILCVYRTGIFFI